MALIAIRFLLFHAIGSMDTLPKKSISVSTQGKKSLSLHGCIKCVTFFKCKFAFNAIRLLLVHVPALYYRKFAKKIDLK